MRQTTILDKLKLIFDLSTSNVIYIVALCILIFITALFITTNR